MNRPTNAYMSRDPGGNAPLTEYVSPEHSNRWWVDRPLSCCACWTRIPSIWRSSRTEKDASLARVQVGPACTKKCCPAPKSAQIEASQGPGCWARCPATPSAASASMTFTSMRVSGGGVPSGNGDGNDARAGDAVGATGEAERRPSPGVSVGAIVAGALTAGAHALRRQAANARRSTAVPCRSTRRTGIRLGPS